MLPFPEIFCRIPTIAMDPTGVSLNSFLGFRLSGSASPLISYNQPSPKNPFRILFDLRRKSSKRTSKYVVFHHGASATKCSLPSRNQQTPLDFPHPVRSHRCNPFLHFRLAFVKCPGRAGQHALKLDFFIFFSKNLITGSRQ